LNGATKLIVKKRQRRKANHISGADGGVNIG